MTPRPKIYDEQVTATLLDMLVPKVLQWMKDACDDQEMSSEDLEILRNDVAEAIDYEGDSYQIVKELERNCSWTVNRDLISVMDNVGALRHRAHDSIVEAWVTQHGISPEFSVGSRVAFKDRTGDHLGEVTKVDTKRAQYVVFCEGLGHVRKGHGSYGTYLPYEDVTGEQLKL